MSDIYIRTDEEFKKAKALIKEASEKAKGNPENDDEVIELLQRAVWMFRYGDAPCCAECGSPMEKSGSCYRCSNCGSTSGCS